ncbi:MAG: hypothetical protein V3575_02880 [Candidatus Absconditabacteria bacterium]
MEKIIDGIKIGFGISLAIGLFFVGLYLVRGTWESSLGTNPIDTSGQLYVNGSETLTASKWNAVVQELNALKTQNTSVFSGSGLDVIYCYKSRGEGNAGGTYIIKTFTNAECGGRLPNDNYIPIFKKLGPAGGFNNMEVLKYGEPGYPGLAWRQISGMSSGIMAAYYLKVK